MDLIEEILAVMMRYTFQVFKENWNIVDETEVTDVDSSSTENGIIVTVSKSRVIVKPNWWNIWSK